MTADSTEKIAEDIGGSARAAPGTMLREARLAQNLGVGDVARQLKLSINQVDALEAGDFQRLPGPVFVRGFVRNYARLLKLDADSLLKSVAASLPRGEPLPPAPPSHEIPFPTGAPRRWRGYAVAAAAIVAALAAYEFFPSGSEPVVREPVLATPARPANAQQQAASQTAAFPPDAAPEPAAVAASSDTRFEGPAQTQAEGSALPATGQPGPLATAIVADRSQSTSQVASQDSPPVAAKSAAREEEPAPGPGERQVRMVFEQASWVEIRDRSGRAIFSQLNPRGTEQRVNGRPPLVVVVGNAPGVRLTYDEQPVNLSLHTKVDVARLTLQ